MIKNILADIRYQVGDVKQQKFAPEQVNLTLYKVLNSLNVEYSIQRTSVWVYVPNKQSIVTLPTDCNKLLEVRWVGSVLPFISRRDPLYNRNEYGSALKAVVYDESDYAEVSLYPFPEDVDYDYEVYDAPGGWDLNDATLVRIVDRTYTAYFGSVESTSTPDTGTDDGMWLELIYVQDYAKIPLDDIDIPSQYREAVVYKVSSILLSGDNRDEVIRKASQLQDRYDDELKGIRHNAVAENVDTANLTQYRSI